MKLDLNYQIYTVYTVARESISAFVEIFYESLCVIYIQFQMAFKFDQYRHGDDEISNTSQNIYIKVFYGISSNSFVSHCTPLINNETHSHLRQSYPNIKITQ